MSYRHIAESYASSLGGSSIPTAASKALAAALNPFCATGAITVADASASAAPVGSTRYSTADLRESQF
jgi:hypothetical protein